MAKKESARALGFTLVELMVVMAIIATLLAIVGPKYFGAVDKAKEAALRTDLRILREAIDKYRADNDRLPDSLGALVESKYIRDVPIDPMTDSNSTWIIVPHPGGKIAGVFDIRSGSLGSSHDGALYGSW